jgi:hypothetical protein
MTRSRLVLLPVLLLAVGLAGCSRFNIRTKHDPSADFARLRTFAWLPPSEADPADQRVFDRAIDKRLRAAVDRELRAKGLVPAGDAAPDFLLNYRLARNPASDMRGDPGRLGWGMGWWTGWPGAEAIYTENYDEGTLFLAAIDPHTKRMIWIGAAEARVMPNLSFEKRLQRVDAAVHRILVDFPPR